MAYDARKNQKDVWVEYHVQSGAVEVLHFREPKSVRRGNAMVKTSLSEWVLQRPQHLRVVGERVFHFPSLAGI